MGPSGILIGAGDRGFGAYASCFLRDPRLGRIVAVADPRDARRSAVAQAFGLAAEQVFADHRALLARPRVADFAIIATPDADHLEPALRAIELGYAVLLEKPMATRAEDCEALVSAVEREEGLLQICHVLRYSPLYAAMKGVIESGELGDVVTIRHSENVSTWHYAHSYTRGSWRNRAASSPMILSKSCHDLDLLHWLAGAPPSRLSSFERATELRPENAPEGAPEFCIEGCAHAARCPYDAVSMYRYRSPILLDLQRRSHPAAAIGSAADPEFVALPVAPEWKGWPVSIITDDPSQAGVLHALRTSDYGRCVYRIGDNGQPASQLVNVQFANDVQASFVMHSNSDREGRETRIDGTRGTLRAGFFHSEQWLEVSDHKSGSRRGIALERGEGGHGGSDPKLLAAFVAAVRGEVEAQTSARESLWSHRMAFAADRSAREGVVVEWS